MSHFCFPLKIESSLPEEGMRGPIYRPKAGVEPFHATSQTLGSCRRPSQPGVPSSPVDGFHWYHNEGCQPWKMTLPRLLFSGKGIWLVVSCGLPDRYWASWRLVGALDHGHHQAERHAIAVEDSPGTRLLRQYSESHQQVPHSTWPEHRSRGPGSQSGDMRDEDPCPWRWRVRRRYWERWQRLEMSRQVRRAKLSTTAIWNEEPCPGSSSRTYTEGRCRGSMNSMRQRWTSWIAKDVSLREMPLQATLLLCMVLAGSSTFLEEAWRTNTCLGEYHTLWEDCCLFS